MIDVTRETTVSLVDVARRLGVTVQTVRNWTARTTGALERVKLGGKVMTTWEAVNRFGVQPKVKQSKPTARAKQHEAAGKYLESIGL